jgi:hypothetical protein
LTVSIVYTIIQTVKILNKKDDKWYWITKVIY